MNTEAQYLFDEAMKLPADTREILAAHLLGSIQPSQAQAVEIREAWNEEIERRVAKLESGETTALPIEEVWPKLTSKPWSGAAGEDV